MYLYKLEKLEEMRWDFLSVLRQLLINCIFPYNARILCSYCNVIYTQNSEIYSQKGKNIWHFGGISIRGFLWHVPCSTSVYCYYLYIKHKVPGDFITYQRYIHVAEYSCFESCQFRPRSVFFVSWRLKCSADDFRCLRYYCDNVSISYS